MKIENFDFETKTVDITINKEIVKIKQYLNTTQKMIILNTIIGECLNTELIDQAKLDGLFNALIILNYTDIEIETIDSDSLLQLYDYFESNGYMTLIINAIPKVEYNALTGYLEETVNDYNRFKVSLLGALEGIMAILPMLMERISEISKDIDVDSLTVIKDIYSKLK